MIYFILSASCRFDVYCNDLNWEYLFFSQEEAKGKKKGKGKKDKKEKKDKKGGKKGKKGKGDDVNF